MTLTPESFLELCTGISFGMVLVAIALGFVRLSRGPTLADRVVALDMMSVLIVAFCAVYAVLVRETAFIDVLLVVALIGFLATVALARYAERRTEMDDETKKGRHHD
jgi:multicomponent Na+:H+ antiporter subunit F